MLVTPTLSLALAEIVTDPLTRAPFAGLVMLNVGGVVSGAVVVGVELLTVIVAAAEAPTFPAASYARTWSV
jgi:hypothetical protein